eukprot:4306095-Alexandrium_andersonii.AAC.1
MSRPTCSRAPRTPLRIARLRLRSRIACVASPARGCGHPEGGVRMESWASPAWRANTPTCS